VRNQIDIAEIFGTSLLIRDYLTKKESLTTFYNRAFSYVNLVKQAQEKLAHYPYRKELVTEITSQLDKLALTEKQKDNLYKLSLGNTVTITTGHQLNLMTGPLYFLYKILHTIKLCDSMNRQQNEIHFVPMFWMATEDHDFKEINHFYFRGEKIEWNEEHQDFVGEISTSGGKKILSDFSEKLKYFPNGKKLWEIIEKSYFSENNLADATRVLVHELFKEYGLLFIDGNNKTLKKLFIPYVRDDIKEQKSFHSISQTVEKLKSDYKIQVNPRKINFFYHENQIRNRIDETNGKYYILGTCKNFNQKDILEELENNPEKFSPNALLRPVYQEVILPNVAYIGGNAEIAYWLELKHYFDIQNLPFPILIPRNSILLITENQKKKMDKFHWEGKELFIPKEKIIQSLVEQCTTIKFDLSRYEKQLTDLFTDLLEKSVQTDPSWKDMILAQQKKQLNGLEKINKRFYKAEKLKHKEMVSNFEKLYSDLFPHGTWQERIENFSYYYAIMGINFINLLYKEINEYESVINLSVIQE
jgi:bacillithiol biosynthesis cysteine-adding enzyme BshC